MDHSRIRGEIYRTVRKALEADLIRLSAGNISARTEDGLVAITPTAITYDVLRPQDVALVDLEGGPVDAPMEPSSETPMHTAIYRGLPEVGAILHTHSSMAIAFAMLGQEIPTVNMELLACGSPIPVAAWACPGTAAAGEVTVEVFRRRPELKVCLLRNHGLVAIGSDLPRALAVAIEAEVGLQSYHHALQAGKPEPLSAEQVEEVRRVYSALG
jgi:L-fuculose-phosphate aldolase